MTKPTKTKKPTKAAKEAARWAKLAELLRWQCSVLPSPGCDLAAELVQLIEDD